MKRLFAWFVRIGDRFAAWRMRRALKIAIARAKAKQNKSAQGNPGAHLLI